MHGQSALKSTFTNMYATYALIQTYMYSYCDANQHCIEEICVAKCYITQWGKDSLLFSSCFTIYFDDKNMLRNSKIEYYEYVESCGPFCSMIPATACPTYQHLCDGDDDKFTQVFYIYKDNCHQ